MPPHLVTERDRVPPMMAICSARSAVTLRDHRDGASRGSRYGPPWATMSSGAEALEAGVTQLDLELTRTVADHVAEITTRRHTMAFRVLAALAWGLLLVALTAVLVR